MSIADYAENKLLDAIFNNTSYVEADRFVKLHIGDPGEACTANAAGETTRKGLTNAAASGGVFTSTNNLDWTSVSTTETYTHISIWDAVTVGNALWYGPLSSSKSITAGQNWSILAGQLTVSLS